MPSSTQTLVKAVAWIGAGMVCIVVFHLGGSVALHVGQFSPLIGAFIGGILTLVSAGYPTRKKDPMERWVGLEQLSWVLIGCGIIMWGIGESFWRYYVSINQAPFPSLADLGYFTFPLLAFMGLLLLPSPDAKSKRTVLLMDSLISMGSIFAIAWYLLLGSLAQAPGEASVAKFLGIYYPTADTALLSCVIFLLLRGQGRLYQSNARRFSLLALGLGLCFFVTSDFIFNVQQNAGTYVEATWIDLGWPLGMMTIGVAAYLRRFLPATTSEELMQQDQETQTEHITFSPPQFVPYGLLALLFTALTLDVLASDSGQRAIRPVLLVATLCVVALVVTRQILTLWDNTRLARRQAEALENLARANERIEEQSRQITEYNVELERGIEHLKDVQANLANGNLRARANLVKGALLPLAGSFNLMAERLARLGQVSGYAQRVMRALSDLSIAFERSTSGAPLIIPESCQDLTEINRLLVAMRVKGPSPITNNPSSMSFQRQAQQPLPTQPPMPHPLTQPMMHPFSLHNTTGDYSPPSETPQSPAALQRRLLGPRHLATSGPLQRDSGLGE